MTVSSERGDRPLHGFMPGITFCLLIGLVLPVFLAYLPSLYNGFINLDDSDYILSLRSLSFADIKTLFTSFREGYQPLSLLSLGIERHILGPHLEVNPW